MDLVFVDDIPGLEGEYAISEEGDVYSYKSKRFLTKNVDTDGYLRVQFNGKTQRIHRLLALTYIPNPNNRCFVDHKDTNRLNNSLKNLRWVSHSQNCMNQNKQKRATSSNYKGVSWNKGKNKWRSQIQFEGKKVHVGYFETEEECALAYNEKVSQLFGDFALLNVIEE